MDPRDASSLQQTLSIARRITSLKGTFWKSRAAQDWEVSEGVSEGQSPPVRPTGVAVGWGTYHAHSVGT